MTGPSADAPGRGGGLWPTDGLPRGPHDLPSEQVSANQRARLLKATARAVATHGCLELTVERIVAIAGVSRTTFYAHFEDRRDAVRAALDSVADGLSERIVAACAGEPDWPSKVDAGVRAAIEFAAESPDEAALLIPEMLGPDAEMAARVLVSHGSLAALLRGGREEWPSAVELPDLTEDALIGAASSVVGRRLMWEEPEALPEVAPELVRLMLIPYVGSEEADRLVDATA